MIDATNWSGEQMVKWLFNESEEFENIRAKAQTDSDLTLEVFLNRVESDVMPLDEFYAKFKYAFNAGVQFSKDDLRAGKTTHEKIINVVFESFLESSVNHLAIQMVASQIVDALAKDLESKGLSIDDIDVDSIQIIDVDDLKGYIPNHNARYN
jgi:hypothetical protein